MIYVEGCFLWPMSEVTLKKLSCCMRCPRWVCKQRAQLNGYLLWLHGLIDAGSMLKQAYCVLPMNPWASCCHC